jgi:predicted site-specific integrase-resolvase
MSDLLTLTKPPALSLRPRDAAKALSVSPRTLATWTKAGLIPCAKVGTGKRKTVLYSAAALQDWLANQASAPSVTAK